MKAGKGQNKLIAYITKPDSAGALPVEGSSESAGGGNAYSPETMLTPEQTDRLNETRSQKESEANAGAPIAPQDPKRTEGLKTQDPEYKKKLMAEIQARENAKRSK